MKKVALTIHDVCKRSMKHHVKELKNRDDYEVRISEGQCAVCRRGVEKLQFRIFGKEEWKSACEDWKIMCKECKDHMELNKVLEGSNSNHREKLTSRLEAEYLHIPKDLKNAGFKNFNVHDNNVLNAKKAAMDFTKTFADMEAENRYNLMIMGNPGTGKTHLVTAIARTLKKQGFLIGLITTGTLLSKIKATYKKGGSQTEESIFNDLKKFDLLILDDIGSEARSRDEFDWSKNKLFEIVNLRNGKSTIYTSNFNEQHLSNVVGERVCSRLYYNTKFIELVTDDYRKNFQIK